MRTFLAPFAVLSRLAAMSAALLAGSVAHAQCDSGWIPGEPPIGVNGSARAVTSWDPDGSGPLNPRMIVGGDFTGPDLGILAWYDNAWHALGDGLDGAVHALTTWDPDGEGPEPAQLIAGGSFSSSASRSVNYIARWDEPTQSWQPLGSGMTDWVLAMTSWDPDGPGPAMPELIAAGYFTFAGGAPANRVARWNGAAWQPMPGSFQTAQRALAVWDRDGDGPLPGQLVIGGGVTVVGGVGVSTVYRWDGSAWQPVGPTLNGAVSALTSFDFDGPGPQLAELIAGGTFTSPGNHVARWDGLGWHGLGTGIAGTVNALNVWDSDGSGPTPARLLAGVTTSSPDGQVMSWNGAAWSILGPTTSAVYALTSWDPDGDEPAPAELVIGTVRNVYYLGDGAAGWENFGYGFNYPVQALLPWDPDGDGPEPQHLVAGGDFFLIDDVAVDHIGHWDPVDGAWHPFSPRGMNGDVLALTTWDPDGDGPAGLQVVAGGAFGYANHVEVGSVTRWDPVASQWQSFGLIGLSHYVYALTTWDPDGPGPTAPSLVAGGNFGILGNRIVRFDPITGAHTLGSGVSGGSSIYVAALTTWDPDGPGPLNDLLIAGGSFILAGGVTVNRIAAWNGSAWNALGTGMNERVYALTTWDPDGPGPLNAQLFAAGLFTTAGGVPANGLARWDGVSWQPLSSPIDQTIYTLTTWDPDGPGPAQSSLVAGGSFLNAGGKPVNRIARWDGAAWSPFGKGADGTVQTVVQWTASPAQPGPTELAAGGEFIAIDGRPSAYWARWRECGVCPADLTGDGVIDFSDYLEFLNLFDASDPRADFNMDGLVDFSDYLDFLNHFDAGC